MSVSIIQRATRRDMTTLKDVRIELDLKDPIPGPQIERFIRQASERAATFCRRTFGRETVREHLGDWRKRVGEGGGILLSRAPVVKANRVTIDRVELEEGRFEVDDRCIYLLDAAGERCGWRGASLVVEYVAGWALPGEADFEKPPAGVLPLPDDVQRAVIQLVGAGLSNMRRDDLMVKSETVEGIGRTDYYVQGAGSSLPHPEAEAILSQYRWVNFG